MGIGAVSDWFGDLKKRDLYLVAIFLGSGIGLGQAPWSLPYIAFVFLVLFAFAWKGQKTWRQGALLGWFTGLGYFGITLFWIIEPFLVDAPRHGWMAPFAFTFMIAGMALFWALGAGISVLLGRGRLGPILGLAAGFGMAELLRSYALTGFPWGLVGYIWLDTPFAQLARLAGPHGLGALGLVAACLLAARPTIGFGFAGLLLAISLAIVPPEGENAGKKPITLRLIQPNAPQNEKWDPRFVGKFYQRQLALTSAKADNPVDLIIWPEASVTFWLDDDPAAQHQIKAAAGDADIVIGARRYEGRRFFNSLAVLDENGLAAQIYDKRHLVPFGEYVPFGNMLQKFGIHGLASSEGGGFSKGKSTGLLDFGDVGSVKPLICYEAIFPHLSFSNGTRPDWLLQLTNDAWFGEFAGPQQHLAQARMRAIEQGLPLVRAANTGISAVIDANGRVTAQLGLGEMGFLDAELPEKQELTIYGKTGDWLVIFLLLVVFVVQIPAQIRKRD